MHPKTLFLFLALTGLWLSLSAQSRFPRTVCGLDEEVTQFELERDNAAIPNNSRLIGYLNDIKRVYNQPFAQYNLRSISTKNIAAAHLQRIGENAAARVITINESYYTQKAGSAANQEALLIWVLAHEVQHHTNGDLHYHNNQAASNLKKEILADERAGYAVGKLTDVSIDFFTEVLPRILYPNTKSNTHPPRDYRVLSAQAGWMRAKLDNASEVTVAGITYKKHIDAEGNQSWFDTRLGGHIAFAIYDNSDIYIGQVRPGEKSGKGAYISYDAPNESFSSIYLGHWSKDDRSGMGITMWNSGDRYEGQYRNNKTHGHGTYTWPSGVKYVGNFVNGSFEGKGTMYYTDESIHRGEWKAGKRHGDGILYRGDEILKAGCWENDRYIGLSCE